MKYDNMNRKELIDSLENAIESCEIFRMMNDKNMERAWNEQIEFILERLSKL